MTTINLPPNSGNTGRPDVRAQTLQQKFGFQDGELATEQHDAIVLWLDIHMNDVLADVLGFTGQWPAKTLREERARADVYRGACVRTLKEWQTRIQSRTYAGDHGNYGYAMQLSEDAWAAKRDAELKHITAAIEAVTQWPDLPDPMPPTMQVTKKHWEHAITTDRGFVVGFVDMRVAYTTSHVQVEWHKENLQSTPEKCVPYWERFEHGQHVSFEVKSYIKSAGEVIRQVRLYQEYLKDRFVIVSPDTRYAGILREQGIGFVEYPRAE